MSKKSNGVRKSFFSQLKKMQKSEESEALVPATFLVLAVLDVIPHPGDIGYFYTEKWLQQNQSKMNSRKFWTYKVANYYAWDAAWFMSLFALTYYGGKNVNQKLKLGIGAVSIGLLAHFIFKQSQNHRKRKAMAARASVAHRLPRSSALARIGQIVPRAEALLLDVRTPSEYASGHIPGAKLIPTPLPPLDDRAVATLRRNLEIATRGYPRRTRIMTYCKKGIRAGKAEEILRSMGFEDVRNLGGVLTDPRLAVIARERACPYCAMMFRSDPAQPIVCPYCGCRLKA